MKIDHADALEWLPQQPDAQARLVVFDPPYAVGTPVRGREDGAAGSVHGPLSFLSRTLAEVKRTLMPGGVCLIFCDFKRSTDLCYIASTVGLRISTCVAWTRKRPGTGGLFRSAWDPIIIASRGTPDAVDRAAIRNVIEVDHPTKKRHPYEKPRAIFEYIFPRCVRPGELILDPFAGSAVSGEVALDLGYRWSGCDIDPDYTSDDG